METIIIEKAVMSSGSDAVNPKQIGSYFFVGAYVDVYCTFVGITSTYCVRISELFKTKEEAEQATLINYIIVENGPIVQEGGKLKYYPPKGTISPINQIGLELKFGRRVG